MVTMMITRMLDGITFQGRLGTAISVSGFVRLSKSDPASCREIFAHIYGSLFIVVI